MDQANIFSWNIIGNTGNGWKSTVWGPEWMGMGGNRPGTCGMLQNSLLIVFSQGWKSVCWTKSTCMNRRRCWNWCSNCSISLSLLLYLSLEGCSLDNCWELSHSRRYFVGPGPFNRPSDRMSWILEYCNYCPVSALILVITHGKQGKVLGIVGIRLETSTHTRTWHAHIDQLELCQNLPKLIQTPPVSFKCLSNCIGGELRPLCDFMLWCCDVMQPFRYRLIIENLQLSSQMTLGYSE